jgi:gliding motility-associated-like protein
MIVFRSLILTFGRSDFFVLLSRENIFSRMGKNLGLLFTLSLLMLSFCVFGTHNRAGEITYRHISGNTYEVTVTTYTKTSAPADRCEVEVFWGDNTSSILPRVNGPTGGACSPNGMGVPLPNDVKKNVYVGIHSYPSAGTWTITMQDPNRNAGIANIPNSVNVVFFLQTTLIINPILGPNSSPELLNPPIDEGCTGQIFQHNPAAFDIDGDSLAYRLVNVRGVNGIEFGTTYDPGFVQDSVIIDERTGTLTWNTPQVQGQFNFAIEIREYRKSPSGVYALLSRVTRDLQVTIQACNNQPPEITPAGPFCVIAGDTVSFSMTATDPDGHPLSLTALGGPFEIPPAAFLTGNSSGIGSVTRQFVWYTECSHVRQQNHFVVFRAEDDPPISGRPPLTAYETVEIRVISPPPLNPDAIGSVSGIDLSWDPPACTDLTRYNIYRKEDPSGWDPDSCQTGIPGFTGFERIGQVNSSTLFYNDVTAEKVGITYCYRIVAVFPDGAESIASDEVCAELPITSAVMTNADVETTDTINGIINVAWTRPYDLDSSFFPPPYRYYLLRTTGANDTNFTPIHFADDLFDTTFTDTGLNTQDSIYRYRTDLFLWPDSIKIGEAVPATSPFLRARGSNGEIRLTYQFNGPWRNDTIVVFREDENIPGQFDSIGFSTTASYLDTGLVNGETYCYKILTLGRFRNPDLPQDLENRSQITCGMALDTSRPCPPVVFNNFQCPENTLTFDFSDATEEECEGQEFMFYTIYYKPMLDDDYPDEPLFTGITQNSFSGFSKPFSGCYKITVTKRNPQDPAGTPRESDFSEEFCIDACPDIEFPNVFTPNGDGKNDFFRPVPTPRDILFIDIKIFNRWGNMMYQNESTEQFIFEGWDGNDRETRLPASAGVYFYVAKIIYRGLTPQEEISIKGDIHLFR